MCWLMVKCHCSVVSTSGYNPDVGVIFCLLELGLEKGMEKEGGGKGCSVSWK